VILLPQDVPTPLVTFAVPFLGCAYGLIFTASHNPPQYNGLKVFRADGSLPLSDETDRYQNEANSLTPSDIVSLDLRIARSAGLVVDRDLSNEYIDAIENIVDVESVRRLASSAGGRSLRVLVDPMYGTSQLTLGTILSDMRCRSEFIHERHNPLFGGHSPKPDPESLSTLITMIRSAHEQAHDGAPGYDLGMATDGDSDRIGIIDEQGNYIETNDLLLLVYWYLHEVRGMKGGVVRNLATTHLLDRLAEHFGEAHKEVPVGFKYITAGMDEIGALMGGESSGGLTTNNWILGKDGIFACALVVEMLSRTGRSITELLTDVHAITGTLYDLETGIPATPEMRVELPRRMAAAAPTDIADYPVSHIDTLDGIKVYLSPTRANPDGDWALLRFSGTEPVLRMFVEADSPAKAQQLIDWLSDFAVGR
jgi:phosphomannomutase